MQQKENLIELLAEGEELSPEEVSSRLDIPKTRVAEIAAEIKSMGYEIRSTKTGYLLEGGDDLLVPSRIRSSLKTETIGREIRYFLETGSTNRVAEKLADEGAPEGTIVVAERQTGGMGRSGRSWYSGSRGGIYLSLVIRPPLAPAEAQGVTIMTAVAAYRSLKKYGDLPLTIKWPNDILINGKKAAGILTSMKSDGKSISHIVIGIGLNVNTEISSMPPEIREIATSLYHETGKFISKTEVLASFLASFESGYRMFKSGRFREIIEMWIKYSGLSGKIVEITTGSKKMSGRVKGLDSNGYLLIEKQGGDRVKIISGEITKIE